jgi:glycerol-3-phosphate cytidylyltransferase-like family protein
MMSNDIDNERKKVIQYLKEVDETTKMASAMLKDDNVREHHEQLVTNLTDMVIAKAFLSSKLTMLGRVQ